MTIYTFYERTYRDVGKIFVAGVLDTEKGEVAGDPSGSLWDTIKSAVEDIQDEDQLFNAFFDGARLWIRRGKPIELPDQDEYKRPTLRLVR